MKKILTFSLAALISSVALATPITLQHSKTSYVNSGICSAVVDVTIHDFLGTYDKLYLDLVAKDKAGRVQGTSENVIPTEKYKTFKVKHLGMSLSNQRLCAERVALGQFKLSAPSWLWMAKERIC